MKTQLTDQQFAATRMPQGTRKVVSANGVRGWLYEFQTELGHHFMMFAYFDGYYQVMVLTPKLEHYYCNPHTGHLYADGRICMGAAMQSGRRTLADAYAKSVLWANGLSAMLAQEALTGKRIPFPFNFND